MTQDFEDRGKQPAWRVGEWLTLAFIIPPAFAVFGSQVLALVRAATRIAQ